MTPHQVTSFYGDENKAAHALKITRQAVNYWKNSNRIPMKTQAWIEFLSNGKLKADRK